MNALKLRDLQLFAIFRFEVDFSETYLLTSAENSVSEPPNLKTFLVRIPPTPHTRPLPSALAIMPPPPPPPPRYKKPSYGPVARRLNCVFTNDGKTIP